MSALKKCRKVTVTGTGGPTLRINGSRGAGYAGLATCGSVWSCPCCAPKIASRRASELADVMAAVHRSGGSAYLLTLTMRHRQGQRLADLWAAVSAAWSAVTTGKAWVADQAGMLGWARVVEATHSPRSGWHLHIHALICWEREVTALEAQRVAMRAWLRWDRALRRRGLDSTPTRGVDARPVRLGDGGLGTYFTKAAHEVAGGHTKTARDGRTPLAILRDAVESYRAEDCALLWEWEQASHGRRQLTWSTSERMDLRRFAGLRDEQTDEEIAAEDTGGTDVLALARAAWDSITATGTAPELLDAADTGGLCGATSWLDARGLPWSTPAPAPRRRPTVTPFPQTVREARAVLRPAHTRAKRSHQQ